MSSSVTVLGVAPASGPRTLPQLFLPQWPAMARGLALLVGTNLCTLAVPRLVNMGIDVVEGRAVRWPTGLTWAAAVVPSSSTLLVLLAAIVVAAIIGALLRTASRVVLFNTGRDVEQDMRRQLFSHLGTLSQTWFGTSSTGDVMSRMTNDLTNIRLLSGFAFLNAANATIVAVVTLPLLFAIDPTVAALALIPFPLVIVSSQLVSKRMFKRTRDNQDAIGALSSVVQESLAGQMVVRALSQEDAMAARFSVKNDTVYDTAMKLARVRLLMGPLMGLMGSLSIAIALYAGGRAVVDGRMTIGDIVEFNTRIMQLTWPMIALGFIVSVWQRGKASLVRINDVLAARPDIVDGPHRRTGARHDGAVSITHLDVTLGTPARKVVDDASLAVKAGGFLGIVGRNGSGKSLLLKAIAGQLPVARGAVFIDDVDVRDWQLESLRQAPGGLGVVPEDGFLFSASIRDNLTFGIGDVDDATVEAVIDLVDLRRDINRLPEGVHTMVGERGVTLSGGQRQRVALGRALLSRPAILMLDDSLSAVDVETEQHIIAALKAAEMQTTIIMVSHRLSVLRGADEIVGLDSGRVVERGTHAQLLASGGLYATLWGEQERQAALQARLEASASVPVAAVAAVGGGQ